MSKLVVIACILLLAELAAAQTPSSGNAYLGYSYYNTDFSSFGRGSGLNGWEASLEGKVIPGLGIVADLGGHYGSANFANPGGTCAIGVNCSPSNESTHIFDALFGPRFSASFGKFRPFVEYEFGVSHLSTPDLGSSTGFTNAIGGGLDFRIVRPVAWRVQVDGVWTHFFDQYQGNVRVSTGIVLGF